MKKGENNDRFLLLGLMCILYLEINVIKTVHQVMKPPELEEYFV